MALQPTGPKDMPRTPTDERGLPIAAPNPRQGEHRSGLPYPDTAWKTPAQHDLDKAITRSNPKKK